MMGQLTWSTLNPFYAALFMTNHIKFCIHEKRQDIKMGIITILQSIKQI